MVAKQFGHAQGSPLPRINSAWRRIAFTFVSIAIAYKVYQEKNRYTDDPRQLRPTQPGAFVGDFADPVERKSKYEGAGSSALGRARGDRLGFFSGMSQRGKNNEE
ncbi:hypothetical protein B9G98_03658 [Wickerhamiella sorbophila]|uniref:Uncharacterized protein n=1 Tax=Wickerhamiella sorbophila TaxID=45607 RepID=A0A2T0FM22_9ASCO|nr:hypothetical protein B9G98_03658 [Wickerhamiella sorbophila]PRT56038.1 hypothetical protein B9G98_03658 [Wickerhamiella sorbophila]